MKPGTIYPLSIVGLNCLEDKTSEKVAQVRLDTHCDGKFLIEGETAFKFQVI